MTWTTGEPGLNMPIPWVYQKLGNAIYPLVNIQKTIENGPVEIVDLPINSMAIFHSYVNVYQRVDMT